MINEGRIDFACSKWERSASDNPEASESVVEAIETELLRSGRAHWIKSASWRPM